jgi:uncharacterized protein (DUF58 family)
MHRILRALRTIPHRLQPLWRIEKPAGQAQITLRYPQALVVFGLLLTWYIARPSPVAVLATVGLGGMLAAGYVWARRMAIGLSAERRLQYAAVQVGDEIEEIVTLRNDSALPTLWAEFSDHSNIPGYNLTSVRAVDGNNSLQWRAHAVCRLRGNYRFGPWELLTGDLFGLFKVTLSYNQQEEILIYPPLAALPEQILPRGRSQGDDRPLHQPLQAESMSALGTRPYAPGDPLRRIHWPTTARHDVPFVKTFDPEASSTLWLIPDLDSAVQRGEGPDSTLETMIMLVASLADRMLKERLAVGLIAYTPAPAVVMPSHGKPHLWQLLRLLAGLQANPLPLAEVLGHARTVISGRARVIVVTPSLQPDWAGKLSRLGAVSRRSGAEVILMDAETFAAPPGASQPPTGGKSQVDTFVAFLASLGIPAHTLRQGEIQPNLAAYGELSRWEFKTLATGRAIAHHVPHARYYDPQKPASRAG